MSEIPPRLAEAFLRRLVPGREGETIAGDLREEFEARGGGALWYWRQVLSCGAVRLSRHRLRAPGFGRDFHFALRVIRRNPGYALAAMLCLALGIGVNTTVFSMVDGMFLRTLPLPDAGRVVSIDRTDADWTCSYRDYLDLRQRSGALFSGLAAIDELPTSLDTDGTSQIIIAESVSANFAQALGLRLQMGRWFVPEDELPGAEPVGVLSDHAWSARFHRDPNAIGKRVRIETQWHRIIGIAQADFRGVSPPASAEIWVPLTSQPYFRKQLENPAERDWPTVRLVGRLAPGVSLSAAQERLRLYDRQIRGEFPHKNSPGPMTVAVAAGVGYPGARRMVVPVAALMLAVTAVVLLIACVNVANLLLSRAAVRRHEMALRRALGAGQWRLLRQTLAEGLTLAAGGALLGLVLGYWTNRLLVVFLPAIPNMEMIALDIQVNWRVALFAGATALLSAVLFTVSPAIEHSRAELVAALKGTAGRRARQRDLYVVAQVALSLVLLIAAGLLVRALDHAKAIDPGFAMDHRLTARIYISAPEYTPETGRQFFGRLLDEVRAAPGVKGAALSYTLPLAAISDHHCVSADRATAGPRTGSDIVTPGYFGAMSIPLLRGRDFDERDGAESPKAVIVNETLADRYWPGQQAVGKPVWIGCDGSKPLTMAEVAGVAKTARYRSLEEPAQPFVYFPLSQNWAGFVALTAHTSGDPAAFAEPLRGIIRRLDPGLRIYEMRTLQEHAARSLWLVRWQAALIGGLGGLAIVLAAVGLYGVVAYSVAQRTREIGVRMAMGAQASDVLWMVLGRGLRLTALGIALGVALSAGATRFLRAFLYGVSPLDWVAFLAASLFWVATAMLASYIPARRATRVDPMAALRYE